MRHSAPIFLGLFLVTVAAGVAIYTYSRSNGSASADLLQYTDASTVAAGESIYRIHCASCHGAELEGEPNWQRPNSDSTMPAPPHNERGHTWHHTDQVLFDLTKYGVEKFVKLDNYKSNMPAYENVLTDEEIIAVLSFIKNTWPDNIQASHDALNARKRKSKQ